MLASWRVYVGLQYNCAVVYSINSVRLSICTITNLVKWHLAPIFQTSLYISALKFAIFDKNDFLFQSLPILAFKTNLGDISNIYQHEKWDHQCKFTNNLFSCIMHASVGVPPIACTKCKGRAWIYRSIITTNVRCNKLENISIKLQTWCNTVIGREHAEFLEHRFSYAWLRKC